MTGTRNITAHGYARVHLPGHPMAHRYGWAYEHRVVAFDAGLLDGPDDDRHVHHRNHDRADNRLENLEVLAATDHHAEHRTIDRDQAAALYESGLTVAAVAERLGTYSGNISRALSERGVTARPQPTTRPDISDEDVVRRLLAGQGVHRIARELGCSYSPIIRIRKAAGIPSQRPGRPRRAA